MKFEVGKTYYGIEPGVQASCREITVLAIEDDAAAVRVVNVMGEVTLDVWTAQGSDIFEDWTKEYYQETPWRPEIKEGDRVTFEWQGAGISHYVLREKFVNKRVPAGYGSPVQWVCLRIYRDGTTRLCLLSGDLDDAQPYKK